MTTITVSRIKSDGTVSEFKTPINIMFMARLLGAKFGGKGNEKALADEHRLGLALAMDAKEFHVTVDGVETVCSKSDLRNAVTEMKACIASYQKASKLASELKLAKEEYRKHVASVEKYAKRPHTATESAVKSGKASKRQTKQAEADSEMK